jgi:ubiquinol-cytochrome c reductase cytochrome b subunit/menaquinol-cytochrome c reductase cytochrome b/c subunit
VAESKLKRAQRDGYKRYKDDVKREGKPFFPYAMYHDTIMSLVVVIVIIALAVIWRETAIHAKDHVGLLGPLTSAKADPGTTSFVPRPDWFFYFLFYLLRVFKWPDSVFLGTVGVPTILLILLIGLPFYDRRTERRVLRRPVSVVAAVLVVISMGVLTWKGAIAKESVGAENVQFVPSWAQKQGFADNAKAVAGAKVFASLTCMNCHAYLGAGSSGPGPDLSAIGKGGRGAQGFADYVAQPSKFGNNVMPPFADIGADNLAALGEFLNASKGAKK